MRKAIISLLAFLTCVTAMAQETAWRDTLKAAVKTDSRRIEASLGRLHTGFEGMRGVNENTNGLIRQYIPKGTDFSELTDEMLAEIEWKLNHRPRKSLGYRTPLECCKQLFNFDF